ncbi:hypothetical protein BCT63_16020 [Vibrio kanaloae]|uniref:Uncharacterized protein n=1 Tax=Vibrio kanaloae TaxID=170673 RepID=A0A2N7J9B2_9VIBR|nr:hypothetical protein [Vibrio kanaloae]PMM02894.1 hypothetical protein BCT63_16020 [Vibrio kanaloae]TKF22877.1 hypothetical protein FCV50_23435 [Vibrio kanaloae]TKF74066.1 hypothetical protein FCV62_22000 [Vibrio kanaloae]
MSIKERTLSIVLIAITAITLIYYLAPSEKIWGAGEESYMVIAGKKPLDAKISVRVNYFGRGESCSGWSWSAVSGDVKKGIYNESFNIEHNFSQTKDSYELRIPYQPRQPEANCITQLSNMEVKLVNAFDTVGFANLRIHRAGTDYDNKPMDVSSKVEAKMCEPFYSQKHDRWTNGFGCYFYVNDKKTSNRQEFNAYTVHFDFSQFNDNTVIHYDILAGDDYRSTPLDPQTGK